MPGTATEPILLGPPDGAATNRVVEIPIHLGDASLEPAAVLPDAASRGALGMLEAIALRDEHIEESAAACDEGRQRLQGGIG
jgi:hypothetical protein